MGHREQDLFERARWRLAVLVPAWIAQFVFMLGLMGIFAYRLVDTIEHWEDEKHTFEYPEILVAWESSNVGLNLIAVILTCLEIARYTSETLTPVTMLVSQAVKLGCASANLGLDIYVYLSFQEGHWSWIGLGIDCGLIALSLIPLIYSILIHRRVSSTHAYTYTHPTNIRHFGFKSDSTYPSQPDQHARKRGSSSASAMESASGAYALPSSRLSSSYGNSVGITGGGGSPRPSLDPRRESGTSWFSGLGGKKGSRYSLAPTSSVGEEVDGVRGVSRLSMAGSVMSGGTKRESAYNHERDTGFDDYLKRRSQLGPGGGRGEDGEEVQGLKRAVIVEEGGVGVLVLEEDERDSDFDDDDDGHHDRGRGTDGDRGSACSGCSSGNGCDGCSGRYYHPYRSLGSDQSGRGEGIDYSDGGSSDRGSVDSGSRGGGRGRPGISGWAVDARSILAVPAPGGSKKTGRTTEDSNRSGSRGKAS